MYSNTYSSIIIPIFVVIQFCNIILIFTSHQPFIFIFVRILSCQFLGNDNRYMVEFFNVHLYFNELSIDISHFFVS